MYCHTGYDSHDSRCTIFSVGKKVLIEMLANAGYIKMVANIGTDKNSEYYQERLPFEV